MMFLKKLTRWQDLVHMFFKGTQFVKRLYNLLKAIRQLETAVNDSLKIFKKFKPSTDPFDAFKSVSEIVGISGESFSNSVNLFLDTEKVILKRILHGQSL